MQRSWQSRLASLSARVDSTGQAKLRRNAIDAMSRVQVLHNDELVASGATLASSDNGPGEEELPNL